MLLRRGRSVHGVAVHRLVPIHWMLLMMMWWLLRQIIFISRAGMMHMVLARL